jgi:hypothetical protein
VLASEAKPGAILGRGDVPGPWRGESQVGVVGQFGGPPTGAFGQFAFGQRLQPPDQAPDQPDFVAGASRFAGRGRPCR